MTVFLSSDVLDAIKQSVIADDNAVLAVAYWGQDAVKLLGIDKSRATLRILCDLRSGACDPSEIAKLLKRPRTEVRTRDRFHGKVYLSSDHAVVGSANASRKGLGEQSALEAAVLLKDRDAIRGAEQWFEQLWSQKDTQCVTPELLKEVTPLWLFKKTLSSPTLLQVLRQQPEIFEKTRIRFVVFWEPTNFKRLNDKYNSMWDTIKDAGIYSPAEIQRYGDKNHPFYIDEANWKISVGDYVINYWVHADKPETITLGGIWRVKAIKKLKKQNVVMGHQITKPEKLFGFRFPKAEQAELSKLMQLHRRKAIFDKGKHLVIEIAPRDLIGTR